MVEPEYVIKARALTQMNTSEKINAVQTFINAVIAAVIVVVASSFTIKLLLQAAISQILAGISALVIFCHILLINIAYPITAQMFFGGLMSIVTFQFYNFTDYYN